MRTLANLFLILFIADGGFSLMDELVGLLTPLMPFSDFRNFLASLVIMLSIPVYLCLGIDSRLPKRLFLPLIAFIYWTLISTWLFPALGDLKVYGLLLALVQIALGMLPLLLYRNGDQRRVRLPQELFSPPFFNLRSTLMFFTANLVLVPCALGMFVMALGNAYLQDYTAGFMRLAPGGLRMSERSYVRDNRTVRLAAMIHIGSREYYRSMAESGGGGRTIVLAEGVSDQNKELKNGLDYGKMARLVGLVPQDKLLISGRVIDDVDQASEPGNARGADGGSGNQEPDILRADVDISSFRPATINFLNAIGLHMSESRSLAQAILTLNSWAEKNVTPEMYETFMDDILHRRNQVLIGHLDQALTRYDTVIIPWGALHMKEIEEELLKRGFMPKEKRERVSIDFTGLLKN